MSGVPHQLARHDYKAFFLLVVLYFLQGIPVGLAFGTVPFLLKSGARETTFTQLGVFALATYPYSLKIIWSPIVDSIYSKKTGRRRSWIIPVQLASGIILWAIGFCVSNNLVFAGIDDSYSTGNAPVKQGVRPTDITTLTICFLLLVFLCATQDIAVDGWALEILSKQSLSYASTAQTVGLNTGYFLSFTIFLTFNSSDFMNRYIRSEPLEYGLISFGGYLKFAGTVYLAVTFYIMFFTNERPSNCSVLPSTAKKSDEKQVIDYNVETDASSISLKNVYLLFFKVLKLPSVRSLMLIHLVSKFAFQCNEGATNLKLLERGFKREDLAVTVLVDFPFEIIFGYYVAKWSSSATFGPRKFERSNFFARMLVGEAGILTPWLWGFLGRLLSAFLAGILVAKFPSDGIVTRSYFLMVIFQHLLGSFMTTVQFVAICAFHTRIADSAIGGTYMTLLNTFSNLGGTWPRLLVMTMIDRLTKHECVGTGAQPLDATDEGLCKAAGGTWMIARDGYFVSNFCCITVGIVLYFTFIRKRAQRLQLLPESAWHCS